VFLVGTMPLQISFRRNAHDTIYLLGTVQIVKQRLEKERDLEGIDLGNIVSGGRRSRTGNTASINYKCVCHLQDPTLRWHVHQRLWRGQSYMLKRGALALLCDVCSSVDRLHDLRDRAMGGEDSEEDGEDERDKPAADSSSSSSGADRSEGDVSDGGANSNGVSAVFSRVRH